MTQLLNSPLKPNINRFHVALESMSIDTAALYEALDISPRKMMAENSNIPMSKYFELMEEASKLSGQRFLSTNISLQLKSRNFGMLEYLLKNAANFEQGLKLLHRYLILVSPGAFTTLIEHGDECILTYKNSHISPVSCRQDVEGTIAQFIVMIRIVINDNTWLPKSIYFEHPSPTNKELREYPFSSELIFDHIYSGISFPKAYLSFPINNSDPTLLALLESQIELGEDDSLNSECLIDSINLVISAKLGQAEVTADIVAKELGMSRRSLNRRLKDNNTTFKTIRESLLLQIAKQKLCNSNISITNLAQELGYSDSSAFNRAFKRLTGFKPLEYRKRHSMN